MPAGPPVPVAPGLLLSRRGAVSALAIGGLLPLSACTSQPAAGPGPTPPRDPDEPLLRAALRAEVSMLTTLTSLPGLRRGDEHLRRRVAGAQRVHRAHVALLQEAVREAPSPRAGAAPAPRRLREPEGAVRAVVLAERRLATAHARRSVTADSGAFARVLAGMAASAAQQAVALGGGA